MLTRSSLLSLLLIVAIGLVLTKTYWLWMSGPWDLPNPRKAKSPIGVEDAKAVTNPRSIIGTETIISKNIFDPERGAGLTREAEANSQAFQRIRSMVLLGTAILGNNRFAILQDGGVSPGAPAALANQLAPMRIKLGDTVEGFKLVGDFGKKNCFCQGHRDGRGAARLFSQNRCRSAAKISSGANKSCGTSACARSCRA